MPEIVEPAWRDYAQRALLEDRADRDVTTGLLGRRAAQPGVGEFRAEATFILAGVPLAEAVFLELNDAVEVERGVAEGCQVEPGACFARVRGPVGVLLSGERVALNYLQRLCGIATVTRRVVDAVAGTGAVITDTRKTTPGLRELEKYAVRVGGGVNHRASLADAVLWKDNHWEILDAGPGALTEVLRAVPDGVPVCVEVETEEQLAAALEAGVTWILADNQPPDVVRRWVQRCGSGVTVEASGGVTPETAADYARAGARRISLGALTYAPDPVSISFEVSLSVGQSDGQSDSLTV